MLTVFRPGASRAGSGNRGNGHRTLFEAPWDVPARAGNHFLFESSGIALKALFLAEAVRGAGQIAARLQ